MTNSPRYQADVLQDRLGFKLAARLSEGAAALPHDISERLRAARVQAVGQRKRVRAQTATAVVGSGGAAALLLGDDGPGLWSRMASLVPLVALVAGLLIIDTIQNENRAQEVAEVDAALLTDDLPPEAYTDPGFMQFLKSSRDQDQ
ncbi:MAG TPA: DUF3619 family protein [Burkholderiaceae bacterium]|nr:DUF3619 family protein [Burkholderiaceae bacterium]